MSLANATGAPSIITVNETDYRVTPLTLRDMGFLEQWLKDDCIRQARRQAEETDDPQMRSLLLREGFNKAGEIDVALKLNEYLSSFKFSSLLILLALQHEHPELREEDIDSLGVVDQIAQQFITAATNWGSSEDEADTKKKQ